MLAWLIGGACAALGLGVVIYALGRRGRKINDHPQCTWCRADLAGQEKLETCEACGAGLTRAGGVRQGVRVRRRGMIAGGIGLGVMGLVFGLMAGLFWVAPASVYKRLPSAWLLRLQDDPRPVGSSTRDGEARGESAIARVLLDRVREKDPDLMVHLSEPLINRVLNEQLRVDARWDESWGAIFEELLSAQIADEEHHAEYVLNAVQMALKVRDVVARDSPFPVRVQMLPGRVGLKALYNVMVYLQSVRVGGKLVPLIESPSLDSLNSRGVTPSFTAYGIQVAGADAASRNVQQQFSWHLAGIPDSVPLGNQQIVVRIHAKYDGDSVSTASRGIHFGGRGITLRAQTRVVANEAQAISRKVLTPKEAASVESALRSQPLSIQLFELKEPPPAAFASYRVQSLVDIFVPNVQIGISTPYILNVFMEIDGQEVYLGAMNSIANKNIQEDLGRKNPTIRRLVARHFQGRDRITLIYRSDVQAALKTLDTSEVLDMEMRIENIAISWRPPGMVSITPYDTDAFYINTEAGGKRRSYGGAARDFERSYGISKDVAPR